ncbi:glutamate--tRNA ligase [Candidatus Wolfebacteria bacterium]|nr:glutamate--tRNA ligase [Candidatus Wolfebacteria bacterium]
MTDNPNKEIRVRFAPSPTGLFHIGSARTALFNWLFAKNHNGKFILRIEDTDTERSKPEYEKDIIDSLKWLGLDWDEGINIGGDFGPYRQSERISIYEKYLKKLFDENRAYYCFCSKEELESDRQAMLAQGMAPKYSGRCRSLPPEETKKRVEKGESAVIRFRVPDAEIEFNDIIRGKVKFNTSLMGDMIIAKNLKSPLFNLSGTVDDYEMKITHVIRGEDHLPNTPKQILIQKALGFNEVKYAHLPLILAPDRSKLSKRYMETSLIDYKEQGYLLEAIVNFLAFLGWHPKDDKEILTKTELVAEFDLKRVQKAGAIFNIEKLEWLNSQYITNADPVLLAKQLSDFIPGEWLKDKEFLAKVIALEKERIKKLTDFKNLADFFFELPDYDLNLLYWPRPAPNETKNKEDKEKIASNLKLLIEEVEKIFKADFNKNNLEKSIMPLTEVWGRGELLWPLRVALSGKTASPGPFEIMEILGKEETIQRLKIAIEKIA